MVIQLLLALMVIRVGDHDAQFSFTGFLAGGDSHVGVNHPQQRIRIRPAPRPPWIPYDIPLRARAARRITVWPKMDSPDCGLLESFGPLEPG